MLQANDNDIIDGVVTLPRVGVWHSRLSVDGKVSDFPVEGRVELSLPGITWTGTARQAWSYRGRTHVYVVGGNGRMGVTLPSRQFRSESARMSMVVRETLLEAGEMEPLDRSILNFFPMNWGRQRGSAGDTLTFLGKYLDDFGEILAEQAHHTMSPEQRVEIEEFLDSAKGSFFAWRFQPDGRMLLQSEPWPLFVMNHHVTDERPLSNVMEIRSDDLSIVPGVTFNERKVGRVTHTIRPGKIRTILGLE